MQRQIPVPHGELDGSLAFASRGEGLRRHTSVLYRHGAMEVLFWVGMPPLSSGQSNEVLIKLNCSTGQVRM